MEYIESSEKLNLDDKNIIITIFAGRRQYLRVLNRYLDSLLKKEIINEIHFWNYTRNKKDDRYLKRICSEKGKYQLFSPKEIKKGENWMNHKGGCHWGDYYNYYIYNLKKNDILIKCDDDVVYIDVNTFSNFLEQITKNCLYYPNIINNDVCAYIQSKHGIHDLIGNVDKEVMKLGNETPLTGWEKGWYKSYDKAKMIHELFLGNKEKFNLKCNNIKWGSRFSINMLAGNSETISRYFTQFMLSGDKDDEAFLSATVCQLNKAENIIVSGSKISHFSFNRQDVKRLESRFLKFYDKMSLEENNITLSIKEKLMNLF